MSHIRQCQPFIGRCKTTTIFGRIQSIQDVVITALTRIYLDLVVPMLFHLLNKCSPHHNMTFFRQTQRFGYSPKPTMPIANNIHNSLNIWSNEFWHVIHRIRWIIISWNQDRLRNGNGVWIDECGEMPIRAPFLLGCEDFFGGEDWLYGCWESIVSHEDGILEGWIVFSKTFLSYVQKNCSQDQSLIEFRVWLEFRVLVQRIDSKRAEKERTQAIIQVPSTNRK